jgi:tetratricopeptide (TPR) repeat protein
MYSTGLTKEEMQYLRQAADAQSGSGKDPFRLFTDVLIDFIENETWEEASSDMLAMCGKASYLRGRYDLNNTLSKGCQNLACRGYAAAAFCKQSLDPRWLNNLRNYVNHAWQSNRYIVFAELIGKISEVLMNLGYADQARTIAEDGIERVTAVTTADENLRTTVQAALLETRLTLAHLAGLAKKRDEAILRLNSAEETAKLLGHVLALTDITYYRANVLTYSHEYEKSLSYLRACIGKYERMGVLQGVANARNLRGIIYLNLGQLQDARDQFEELLLVQQQLNNQVGLAKTLINVGEVDRSLGQLSQMESYNRRALEISQEAEYMRGMAVAKANLGDVALRKGDFGKAIGLYKEVIELTDRAGLLAIHMGVLFQLGDTHHLQCNMNLAIGSYSRARRVAEEILYPLALFHADVSELISRLETDAKPPSELIKKIQDRIPDLEVWVRAANSSPMIDVRRTVFDDDSIDSDLCIFYDPEKNYECRVERTSLEKECFGNLYWMGGLCPYFKDFLDVLESL